MNIEIRQSFVKDSLKLPEKIQKQIARLIKTIEKAETLSEISSCKKLEGFKTAYRIRVGDYRIGFFFENNTVELVRVLTRKEVYRYFP